MAAHAPLLRPRPPGHPLPGTNLRRTKVRLSRCGDAACRVTVRRSARCFKSCRPWRRPAPRPNRHGGSPGRRARAPRHGAYAEPPRRRQGGREGLDEPPANAPTSVPLQTRFGAVAAMTRVVLMRRRHCLIFIKAVSRQSLVLFHKVLRGHFGAETVRDLAGVCQCRTVATPRAVAMRFRADRS
jgi:hypothetical protein